MDAVAKVTLTMIPTVTEMMEAPHLAYSLPADAARKILLRCAALTAALQVAAAEAIGPEADHSADDLLDAHGVARELGMSRSWVAHNAHRLPRPRLIGSRRRWRRADIRAWKGTA